MTITITYAWWWVPAAISVICFGWAFTREDEGGYLSGIDSLIWFAIASFVSAVAWAIAGALK